MNRLPSFTLLSTERSPPSKLANCLAIVSPSPVPAYFLVFESTDRWNGLNILFESSSEIPIPESTTSNCIHFSKSILVNFTISEILKRRGRALGDLLPLGFAAST